MSCRGNSSNFDLFSLIFFSLREAKRLSHRKSITFLPSISSSRKDRYSWNLYALLYTPMEEHFGIVPLEAMSASTPVIAVDSGGPKETVENEKQDFYVRRVRRYF